MRTIKFRAWDKTQKAMIYPESELTKTHHEGSFPPDGMEVEITLEGYAHINQQYAYESTSYLDNELTLLQFTGLRDKNGVEIYEGDYFRNTESGSVFEVYFAENCACYRAKRRDGWHFDLQQLYPIDNWEVIGNIYEEASE
jgi:uncharacterized phage protein (TIGR01671 family)